MIKPCVIWLTGLSGSGKTTLGTQLEKLLHGKVILLDGDELRDVFKNTAFDRDSRIEHNLTVARLAALFERKGYLVIVSLISPYREGRALCRNLCKEFYEVFLDASLSVCEERDVKGLYKKARAGEIKDFTGIDQRYEHPIRPNIKVNTADNSIYDCLEKIIHHIIKQQFEK